jgi:hypothetical protein
MHLSVLWSTPKKTEFMNLQPSVAKQSHNSRRALLSREMEITYDYNKVMYEEKNKK